MGDCPGVEECSQTAVEKLGVGSKSQKSVIGSSLTVTVSQNSPASLIEKDDGQTVAVTDSC